MDTEKMTAKDIFELRKHGLLEDAYEAARQLYILDKGPYASAAMFWTAVDILKSRAHEGKTDEARKILRALERLLPYVPDKAGWVQDAYTSCQKLLDEDESRHHRLEEANNMQMGVWGEEQAAAYLRRKGYTILERDWRSGHRDIDIIAQDGDYLIFVEVKARRSNDFGSPVAAVNYNKQRNLVRAINNYLHYRHVEMPWRFDVVSIVGIPGQEPEIEHIESFQLNCR